MGSECKNCGNELASVCMQCHACMGCKEPTSQAYRIAALEATERELRDAVKVLAVYAHRRTVQANKLDTMPYVKQQVFLGTLGQAKNDVLANPIAAAAVREAGR